MGWGDIQAPYFHPSGVFWMKETFLLMYQPVCPASCGPAEAQQVLNCCLDHVIQDDTS